MIIPEVGSVVVLKSGGPPMTVLFVDREVLAAQCSWKD